MPYFRAVRNLKTPNSTNMKKLLLIATMLLLFGAVSAQIGDVQQKGNWLHSYDGNREVGRFAIGSSDQFLGFSSSIVVVRRCGFGIWEKSGVCKTEHRFKGPLSKRPCKDASKHSQKRVKKPNPLPLLLPNPG
jgi:hypothetical protein